MSAERLSASAVLPLIVAQRADGAIDWTSVARSSVNGWRCWFEVTEAAADELRDALPPIPLPVATFGVRGFMFGEARRHGPDGAAVRAVLARCAERWFLREVRAVPDDVRRALGDLLDALTVERLSAEANNPEKV